MSHALATLLLLAAGAFCFLALGPALAYAGGWARLARRFPRAPAAAPARTAGFQTVWLARGMAYNNAVRVGTSAQGVFLEIPAWLATGHAPVFIPWEALAFAGSERRAWFRVDAYRAGDAGTLAFAAGSRAAALVRQGPAR